MKFLHVVAFLLISGSGFAQTKKVELYDLVKMLVQDTSEYSMIGDWAVNSASKYPVKWETKGINMSEDLNINFYRNGTANIAINGKTFTTQNKPMAWKIMLRGPRMGFTNFTITSTSHAGLKSKTTIDSLFAYKKLDYKILKDCSKNPAAGFYYYQVKMPKKVTAWIKLSWVCAGDNCMIKLDCYDEGSKNLANLNCGR